MTLGTQPEYRFGLGLGRPGHSWRLPRAPHSCGRRALRAKSCANVSPGSFCHLRLQLNLFLFFFPLPPLPCPSGHRAFLRFPALPWCFALLASCLSCSLSASFSFLPSSSVCCFVFPLNCVVRSFLSFHVSIVPGFTLPSPFVLFFRVFDLISALLALVCPMPDSIEAISAARAAGLSRAELAQERS